MNFPRRRFLGSSFTMLGSSLLDALATPLAKWKPGTILQATTVPQTNAKSPVQFVDVAREAGLNSPNVWGDPDHKRYIIEAKGSGLARFDYDNDGWLDIYLTNGTQLGKEWPAGQLTGLGAVVFAWLVYRWQSLWFPIALHICMNLWWVLFSVAKSALGGWFPFALQTTSILLAILITLYWTKRKPRPG